jgi:glutathionylspermidine synthase
MRGRRILRPARTCSLEERQSRRRRYPRRVAGSAIPEAAVPLVRESWGYDRPSIYGRLVLSYDGRGAPKLLEYNADTPTSLLEAAVVQWHWLRDVSPHLDQFNSIHERLVATWSGLRRYLPPLIHFTAIDDVEDGLTVTYLRETAELAGIRTIGLPIGMVGWNGEQFVGEENEAIRSLFKLYPWEWLMQEPFGQHISKSGIPFIVVNKDRARRTRAPSAMYDVVASSSAVFRDDPGTAAEPVRECSV